MLGYGISLGVAHPIFYFLSVVAYPSFLFGYVPLTATLPCPAPLEPQPSQPSLFVPTHVRRRSVPRLSSP